MAAPAVCCRNKLAASSHFLLSVSPPPPPPLLSGLLDLEQKKHGEGMQVNRVAVAEWVTHTSLNTRVMRSNHTSVTVGPAAAQ